MRRTILFLTFILAIIVGCSAAPSVQYTDHQPKKIEDGLEVGSLSEVNLEEDSLGKAIDEIRTGKFGEIHSMLIFKDGKLVLSKCALEIEIRNAVRKRIYTGLTVKNYCLFFAFKPSST
jgi:hypothetical protein